ncbi:MAG: O-antigen ligase family protein [Rhizobiaceae bacterium]
MSLISFARHVLWFWRIPDSVIDRINPWCQPFVIGASVITGTVVTFWIGGTMILCLARTLSGAMALTRRRPIWVLSAIYALWFATHLLFGLAHSTSAETWSEIVETIGFLGIPFLYAGLALTHPRILAPPTELAASMGAIVAFMVAGYQMLNGWPRAEGFIGNPGPFALLTLLLYGYCLVAFVRNSGTFKFIAFTGIIAAFGCVVMSGMRGLWPGLVILPVAVGLIYGSTIRQRMSRNSIGLAIVAIAALSLAAYPIVSERTGILLTEVSTLNDRLDLSRSLDQHLALWNAGYRLISEAPLAGHGLDVEMLMREETMRLYGEAFSLSHFHNAFLDIGVRAGMAGVVLLVALIIAPLIMTARHRSSEFGRFGFAMMSVLMISYVLSGATGLMLGHDVQGIVFVFSVTYWCVFAFEDDVDNV